MAGMGFKESVEELETEVRAAEAVLALHAKKHPKRVAARAEVAKQLQVSRAMLEFARGVDRTAH